MENRPSDKSIPLHLHVLTEGLGLLISGLLVGMSWGSIAACFYYGFSEQLWYFIFLAPFVGAFVVIFLSALLIALLPRLRAGHYTVGKDSMVTYWYLHMCVNRGVYATGLLHFIRSSNLLKYILMRGLGAEVAYSARYSLDTIFSDPSLVSVGANSTIGGKCYIGSHSFLGNRLTLGRIDIGENTLVSYGCTIGAGTKLGDNSEVGLQNFLYGYQVDSGQEIPGFSFMAGDPTLREKIEKKQSRTEHSSH